MVVIRWVLSRIVLRMIVLNKMIVLITGWNVSMGRKMIGQSSFTNRSIIIRGSIVSGRRNGIVERCIKWTKYTCTPLEALWGLCPREW